MPLKRVARRMIPQGLRGTLRLSYAAGLRVRWQDGPVIGTYDRSHPSYSGKLDPCDPHVIHVWFSGVFAVRTPVVLPQFVSSLLKRRSNGIYGLKSYISLKAMRYLISLHLKGKLSFDSFWGKGFKSFCSFPNIEFCIMLNTIKQRDVFDESEVSSSAASELLYDDHTRRFSIRHRNDYDDEYYSD